MTVLSTVRKAGPLLCDGINAAFPFAFKVFSASDVIVTQTNLSNVESTLALTTNYTVALNADQNANPGGTVTCTAVPTSGFYITLTSGVAETQPAQLTNTGGFYPTVINDALDRETILIQQLHEKSNRAITLPVSVSASVSANLPVPVANYFLAWAGDGLSLVNATTVSGGATVSAPMVPVVNAASLAAALALLGGVSTTQAVNGTLQWLTGMTGSVNAIVGTPASQPAAYTAGQVFRWPSIGANTSSTVTLKVGTLLAQNIVRLDGTALAPGDIPATGTMTAIHDGTQLRLTDFAPGMRATPIAATTSGLVVDFTLIPTWARRLTLVLSGVSFNGANHLRVQLGTGGAPTTTGYQATDARINNTPSAAQHPGGAWSTAGFENYIGAAARSLTGLYTFINLPGTNTWIGGWVSVASDGTTSWNNDYGSGSVTLAGALNFLRLTNTGGDAFDAGSAFVIYE